MRCQVAGSLTLSCEKASRRRGRRRRAAALPFGWRQPAHRHAQTRRAQSGRRLSTASIAAAARRGLERVGRRFQSSADTRAASSRRRPAKDHAFNAYRRGPSLQPGPTPAPTEEAFTSVTWGGGSLSWWACWQDTFWLGGWSLSLQFPPLPLSPSQLEKPRTGNGAEILNPAYQLYHTDLKWRARVA